MDFHRLPPAKQATIRKVKFTAVRGPYGTIPIRRFYPKSDVGGTGNGLSALVYMHYGGCTVGSVDEFENGPRILAEEAGNLVSKPVLPFS